MSRLLEKDLKRPDLKGEFECKMCGQKFLHAASLRRHMLTYHIDGLTCQLCNKGIQNETVKQHMQREHGLKTVYTCGCCNWTFLDKSQFHRHTKAIRETGQPGDVVAIVVSGVASGSLFQDVQKPPSLVNAPLSNPTVLNLLSEFIRTQSFVSAAQELTTPAFIAQESSMMFPTGNDFEDKENVPLIHTEQQSTSSISSSSDSGKELLSISPASSTSGPRTPMVQKGSNKRKSIDDFCLQLRAKRAAN
ncbi:hypothetical protein CAEBREN_12448 [Caenorhabditis brenneri]|uniref:C2H2-type domain-containing protein n=1 Tax=Caenorhabditis brenneri TaxID=135651 RepID=G0NJX1_CAEBE|nr:hypothetical protein CAEBREN_12448 [Caenorhabditis brenneri]